MGRNQRSGLCVAALALLGACTSATGPARAPAPPPSESRATVGAHSEARARAALEAESLIGSPYRYGGSSPRGFDCSGLVLYSFAGAGVQGLPHSAAALESLAQPVPLNALEPGDLLFFSLAKRKTSHVGIYVGGRSFVHAPSGGKRVEKVSFDHVYWGPRLGRAGRLEF
jgi:cell wall-associated NlpC family hydrolase